MDQLVEQHYFTSPVYMIKKENFLEPVITVSRRYLEKSKTRKTKKNPVVTMTSSFIKEPEIAEFAQYVSQTAWNILSGQGYKMDNVATYFTEMWTQEHNYLSNMDTHVHGHGVQISAFYFLDVPKGGCKLVVHDPRPGKVMANLYDADKKKITSASHQVYFTPEAGTLVLINSWLPHSFTKNFSKTPMRFVHMNLACTLVPQASKTEVI